jgi:putative nucleotidyltransferase-like protein
MERLPLPEAQVNIFCARSGQGEAGFPWAADQLDWKKVLEYAQIHGVLQFLAASLARAGIKPPSPWNEILKTQQQRNTVRAMVQHRECSAVLRALSEAGVPAVTFKGTSLSKLLYNRVSERISSDIDVLISRADVDRAQAVLAQCGYVRAEGPSRMETEALLACGIEMAFVNAGGVVIEVHWQVLEPGQAFGFPNDFESLHTVGDQIANEDLFLILVMHGLAHRWEMLKWIVDIDAFMRNVTLDWDAIWRRAAETGTLRATKVALLLVRDIFGATLPKQVDDAAAHRLARRYVRSLMEGRHVRPAADFWMQIAARERWSDRRRFASFVVRIKPWDYAGKGPKVLSRFLGLLTRNFRHPQLAEVQKIPELQTPAGS